MLLLSHIRNPKMDILLSHTIFLTLHTDLNIACYTYVSVAPLNLTTLLPPTDAKTHPTGKRVSPIELMPPRPRPHPCPGAKKGRGKRQGHGPRNYLDVRARARAHTPGISISRGAAWGVSFPRYAHAPTHVGTTRGTQA